MHRFVYLEYSKLKMLFCDLWKEISTHTRPSIRNDQANDSPKISLLKQLIHWNLDKELISGAWETHRQLHPQKSSCSLGDES